MWAVPPPLAVHLSLLNTAQFCNAPKEPLGGSGDASAVPPAVFMMLCTAGLFRHLLAASTGEASRRGRAHPEGDGVDLFDF